MKKLNFLFFALLLIAFSACKDDDECPACASCEECEVCEVCEEVIGYKNVTVDFFTTHKDFVVQPATFETVTEQRLAMESHQQGAFFETVTEQILVKGSYKVQKIQEAMQIHIVANSEKDSIAEIACYHFLEETDFQETEVPAEYAIFTRQIVVQNGTGPEVPASYSTVVRQVVVFDSEIVPTTEEQHFTSLTFRIPENRTIEEYLITQFFQQSVTGCMAGNSYRIP